MEEPHLKFSWPACLAVRGNLLPSEIPHIPILIENIPQYISLPDFERNCIKSIQTIGEILPNNKARIVELQSISSINEAKIILNLEKLPINTVYFKDGKGRHLPIWEKSRVFKVFGTLEQRNDSVVLVAHKLLKVQDLQGSMNMLSLLSAVVRPMRYQSLSNNMSIFKQCLNPLTGLQTWEEQDEYYDYHQEVARSAFADMLHDHERNEKYYVALKAAIEKKHHAGEEANVLDIGTGTGLLSMMAAKCGADTITACEAFTPMADCAAQIIKENGFEDKIKLIRKRSTKMTVGKNGDMIKRANILVTEVFDTELIGEGALSTFRHAHEVLLERNSIVVPHSGTVWAQVVESSQVCAWNRVRSIKNEEILIDAPSSIQACSGAAAVHDMQLSRFPRNAFVPLLKPQPIFRFDWSGRKPLLYNEKTLLRVQPITSGIAHAIFMWWDLNMDTDNKVLLSCAPVWEHPDVPNEEKENIKKNNLQKMADLIPWRDHWMQAVYYLPEEVSITRGVEINLIGYHDEYSFWFKLLNGTIDKIPDSPRPVCTCCAHIAYSRTRIGQLNDMNRNQKYLQALKKKITPKSVCLCLSDGCLLALTAAKMGAKVYLLEENFLSRRTIEMFVQENKLSEKVKIIESTSDLLKINEVFDFIFGEPYFISSIVPWENLRFWYLISKFPSSISRMPIAMTIKAVAVEFKDLQKIRAPLGICEGFDLSSFDELVQMSCDKTDPPIEAQPLWEYPCKALSAPFEIAKFDLTQKVNFNEKFNVSNDTSIAVNGFCNGVAVWVDWQLDPEISVSCGPLEEVIPGKRVSWDPYTRQGVHLFRRITNVKKGDTLSWVFILDSLHSEVKLEFSVLTDI